MSLTTATKHLITIALADKAAADNIVASIAAIGTGGMASVDAMDNITTLTTTEATTTLLHAKLNELLAGMVTDGHMADAE